MSSLDQLMKHTTVVADTGDINAIKEHKPQDATTNPSLILKASQMPEYVHLFDEAISYARQHGDSLIDGMKVDKVTLALDKLSVNFGVEILKHIPGRVSTEVDAKFSFDYDNTCIQAERLISLYEEADIPRERILIKVPATWEGICAVESLEEEGIHTNATLIFSYIQALVVAQYEGTLISPFVGRITDYHMKENGLTEYPVADDDYGVQSVVQIYNLLKKYDFKTEVMGASFRHADQIIALAGCDLLTISPNLLHELQERYDDVPIILSMEGAKQSGQENEVIRESDFRLKMCLDPMASYKLSEGIRSFYNDTRKLENMVRERMS
ncbi:transaldolase [Candidatus Woesearchaeota archaeon]|nr:transaldolase [Candidatus Woesearchaeota archaeon]